VKQMSDIERRGARIEEKLDDFMEKLDLVLLIVRSTDWEQ
jgi:hypothetical protein